jgi:hypothetical protein
MLYQVFDTQDEAQAYADAAAERLPRGPGDVTTAWDIPREIKDGRWVVACMDGDGVEWQDEWTVAPRAGGSQSRHTDPPPDLIPIP